MFFKILHAHLQSFYFQEFVLQVTLVMHAKTYVQGSYIEGLISDEFTAKKKKNTKGLQMCLNMKDDKVNDGVTTSNIEDVKYNAADPCALKWIDL